MDIDELEEAITETEKKIQAAEDASAERNKLRPQVGEVSARPGQVTERDWFSVDFEALVPKAMLRRGSSAGKC